MNIAWQMESGKIGYFNDNIEHQDYFGLDKTLNFFNISTSPVCLSKNGMTKIKVILYSVCGRRNHQNFF